MIEHKPVLLRESIAGLNLKRGGIFVDATLGGGGHAREILKKTGEEGIFIGIDTDINSIKRFTKFLRLSKSSTGGKPGSGPKTFWRPEVGNLILIKDNFSNLKNILGGMNVLAVDGILADLGYSSLQLENKAYGLSFQKDAPLDMRLSAAGAKQSGCAGHELTAGKIINKYPEKKLIGILRGFGEEKYAQAIAKKIIGARKKKPVEGTLELAEIIKSAVPAKHRHGKINPATKTFQALRIAVNDELENLKKFLPQAIEALKPGGRLAVITFHSLEDRIVKNIFRDNARGCTCPVNFPECRCGKQPQLKIITKKPVVPGAEEIENNPRARSAKLRIAEKL